MGINIVFSSLCLNFRPWKNSKVLLITTHCLMLADFTYSLITIFFVAKRTSVRQSYVSVVAGANAWACGWRWSGLTRTWRNGSTTKKKRRKVIKGRPCLRCLNQHGINCSTLVFWTVKWCIQGHFYFLLSDYYNWVSDICLSCNVKEMKDRFHSSIKIWKIIDIIVL